MWLLKHLLKPSNLNFQPISQVVKSTPNSPLSVESSRCL
jgi:hypothetical protein